MGPLSKISSASSYSFLPFYHRTFLSLYHRAMAPVCHCGSHFGSAAALLQHQADRHRESASLESIPHVSRAAARAATRAARSRDIRLARRWKGLKTKAPIRIIDAEVIEPSVAPVSSTTPCELVCSYNWQKPKGFQAPGEYPAGLARPNRIPMLKQLNRACTAMAGPYPPHHHPQGSEKHLGAQTRLVDFRVSI